MYSNKYLNQAETLKQGSPNINNRNRPHYYDKFVTGSTNFNSNNFKTA